MADNSCCETSSPEFPDVTVNRTVLEIDGAEAFWRQENLTINASLEATIDYTPVSIAALRVFVNGVLQKYGADYTLNSKTISFTSSPPANAVLIASYIAAASDTLTQGVSATGTIVGFGGSTAPTGWLLTDGAAISQTTYADLFAVIAHDYADDASDEATLEAAGNFRLPDVQMSYYDGATLVSNTAIIKT